VPECLHLDFIGAKDDEISRRRDTRLTAIFQVNWNVSILDFTGAKDDGGGEW